MLIGSRLNIKRIHEEDVLMGPWCLPLPSDEVDLKVRYKILDCPWKNRKEIEAASQEIDAIYEKILQVFSKKLNEFHELEESPRFWRITIGPWLNWMINSIYDKYYRLLEARKKKWGPLLGLSEKYFVIPVDSFDAAIHINHDEHYNLQLITSIARLMNFPVETSRELETARKSYKDLFFREQKESIKSKLYWIIQRIFYPYADIILYNSYHPRLFIKELFLKSRGKIVEVPLSSLKRVPTVPIVQVRRLFKKNFCFRNLSTPEELILQIVSDQIPLCFLEGFNALKESSRKKFGTKTPEKIASSTSWYFDEAFKLWAANSARKGSKLFGLQHGGTYGVMSHLFSEKHEVEITDQYFTWGWKDDLNNKIVPSPSQKLLDIIKYSPNKNISKNILYVGTAGSRFVIQFPETPENFFVYLKTQTEFFSSISQQTSESLRVRLHAEDILWEIKSRLSKKFPNLRFEGTNRSFRESLLDSKIIICDHFSTTFIESIIAGVPTILFFDPKIFLIRDSAQPYFDQLKEVGIFHHSGKDAAEFLNERYDSIHQWWYSEDCQRVIKNFCTQFAKQSDQPLKDWNNLLRKSGIV